jgi:hypothetical protein
MTDAFWAAVGIVLICVTVAAAVAILYLAIHDIKDINDKNNR